MSQAKTISQPIVGYSVKKKAQDKPLESRSAEIVSMHEAVSRPEYLVGSTYKIKAPTCEHALYITINDIILNEGTDNENRRPFEIFINSKNQNDFMWVTALTRMTSAVFRKGGDVSFIVDEFKQVFDPTGGYFIPHSKGVWVNSVVHHIGLKIEEHLKGIGIIKQNKLDKHQ